MRIKIRRVKLLAAMLSLAVLVNCAQKMGNQTGHHSFGTSTFFPNNQLAQKPVKGTIPSGFTRTNQRVQIQETFDKNSNGLPFPLTEAVLKRGRERFEINCAVCHGLTGDGNGRVPQRGFSRPPSFHEQRLRDAPLGHFYDVTSNGFGAMGSYSTQVESADRWAIAAYIRALQLSQNAAVADVPPEKLSSLEGEK